MSSRKLVETVIQNIGKETALEVFSDAMDFAVGSVGGWTPLKNKKDLYSKLFDLLLNLLVKEPSKYESITVNLQNYMLQCASDTKHIAKLYSWYRGLDEDLKPYKLTLENEWAIVKLINKSKDFEPKVKLEMLAIQLEKDKSETGKYAKQYCTAASATFAQKEDLWKQYYMDPKVKDSNHLIAASMEGFNNDEDDAMTKFNEMYFDELINVFKNRKIEFARIFAQLLFPNSDDYVVLINKINELLEKAQNPSITFTKFLKEKKDLLNKKLKAMEIFGSEIVY
jgi:uncharacterized protein YdiU (UPF0061 family)